jgi:hypothetical protein
VRLRAPDTGVLAMNTLEPVTIQCPYCWEAIEILVDCSVDEQEYTEDCQVCCRPIIISVLIDGGVPSVQARSEDD